MARLVETEARRSTDLAGGWLIGCDQVAPHLAKEPAGPSPGTDGLAKWRLTEADELAAWTGALRTRDIVTSRFGVGVTGDEDLLQSLGERSSGHFYFVESVVQIPDVLTSELGEALQP